MSEDSKSTRKPLMMDRRQFLRYSFVGGSAAVFLAACAAPGVTPAGTGESAGEAAAPAESTTAGGTMVWMGHQEVTGLSPADTGPTVQYVLVQNIQDPLVYYNEFVELELVLAESYEVAEDGLTYTFKLNQGVPFHDGKEFTSADVKYTYDFYRDPENASAIIGDFEGIGSIETPDDYTVVVHMDSVNAASLSNWASTPIVQSEYHAEVGEDTYRTAPIGTGAFKLKEWRAAEFTELEAFDDHFRGRPNIDVIRQDVVPEDSVRTIALQTGDADSSVWPLLVEDSIMLEDDPNFIVFRTLASSIKHFPLNNSLPQLSDKRVRQAMMYALDRQRIIDDLWNGAAQVAHSNLSPKNAFYHNPNTKQYPFDPDQAKTLLDEAGWIEGADGVREKDGMKLSFTCTTGTGDQARRPIAELAQQMFKDVGIDMQLEEAPIATILDSMRAGSMDASIFNWTYGSTPEPDPFSTLHSDGGNNFAQFRNEQMDALIEAGIAEVDPDKRKPIYDQIQDLFVEEVPVLYLQFDEWMNVFSTRVEGLPENPLSSDEIYLTARKMSLAE
ncbi:MAG: ABC transporter substrate-binding protein [Caldilineaceae bacterium]